MRLLPNLLPIFGGPVAQINAHHCTINYRAEVHPELEPEAPTYPSFSCGSCNIACILLCRVTATFQLRPV